MVTVGDDPLLGVVVEGRYKIESVIGQGSAGTVYRAMQELIGREVAIKVLHDYLVSDQEFIKRFTQEAKASSRLSHPNIITIYDFGIIPQGGRPYIAMDFLKGTPMSDLLSERNHLTIKRRSPFSNKFAVRSAKPTDKASYTETSSLKILSWSNAADKNCFRSWSISASPDSFKKSLT